MSGGRLTRSGLAQPYLGQRLPRRGRSIACIYSLSFRALFRFLLLPFQSIFSAVFAELLSTFALAIGAAVPDLHLLLSC